MVAGVLLTSLFIGMVSADQGDVVLTAEVLDAPDQPWFEPGQPLVLEPRLVNNGPEVSLLMNPACPVVVNVYNASNVMLVNGSSACPSREQGLDLFAGEELALEPVSWSMKDEAGAWLESGTYIVEVLHSAGASFTTEATIQTPVSLPEELTYAVQTAQRATDGQAVFSGVGSIGIGSCSGSDLVPVSETALQAIKASRPVRLLSWERLVL